MPIDVSGFKALGIDVKPREQDEDVFEVWDINAASLDLFLSVQSQWRVLALGLTGVLVWVGLDYQGVDVVMRRQHIADDDGRLFGDLAVMEGAALAAFSELAR